MRVVRLDALTGPAIEVLGVAAIALALRHFLTPRAHRLAAARVQALPWHEHR